jgi:hypothetical protein
MTAWARPLRTGPQSKHVGGKRTQAGRRFEGRGEALMEGIVFDAGEQPLAGSFQDYAVPRADDFAALISPPATKAAMK